MDESSIVIAHFRTDFEWMNSGEHVNVSEELARPVSRNQLSADLIGQFNDGFALEDNDEMVQWLALLNQDLALCNLGSRSVPLNALDS